MLQRLKNLSEPRRRWLALFLLAVAVGLLFWARLLIVAEIPRPAMAEEHPERTTPDRSESIDGRH